VTDYIVVGAGSAGCVIAARLSEDPSVRVTLIEAGGKGDWRTTVPGMSAALWRTKFDWAFATEPQPDVGGRKLHMPRGKVLGGTSCLNYMVYIRGHRDNFDAWRDAGNEGWGYDDVLPPFKKSERNDRGEGPYHGATGPLDVQTLRRPTPIMARLVEATAEVCKVPRDHDFNGATQEGAGHFQTTTRDGRRCSTALAFLDPARARANLTVVTDAQVERVVVEKGRAVAVRVRRGGRSEDIRAEREIILSAGAFGSPHILMLSGIGPAGHLREHGVTVVHDAPGVGQNLQDHFFGGVVYEAAKGTSYDITPLRGLGWLAMYLAGRRGPLASNFCEAGGFVRTSASLPRPDLQFHFLPTGLGREPNVDLVNYDPRGEAFTLVPTLLYPKSRGQVRLRSADPLAAPSIDPRYLSEADDVRVILDGTRLALEIANAPVMKGVTGKPLTPSSEAGVTDATLRAELQLRGNHIFHPVGTCRMGKGERDVVDDRLRVHGVDGLRVADASIMPDIVGGNTNAACIMIGEKAAVLVKNAIG
jgi:choline dehydrogenase